MKDNYTMQLELLVVIHSLETLCANKYHKDTVSFTHRQIPTVINVNVNHSWE
jgi:hypothetical protein